MTILNLPTFSRTAPSFMTFSLQANTQSFESPLNKSVQTSELPGARWRASFGWNNLTDADARILKAWLLKLVGRAGRFYLHDYTHPAPSGTALGAGVVNGAGQTGRTLQTTGWTPNQTTLFLPGDYFKVGSQLCVITDTVVSDASGNAILVFEPPLRVSPISRTLGSELITNGSFATDTNWTKETGWTISGGTANCNGSARCYQPSVLTLGIKYEITYTITNYISGTFRVQAGSGGPSGAARTSAGTFTDILTCGGNSTFILGWTGTAFSGSIDNVSVKQVLYESESVITSSPKCTMMLIDDNQDNFTFEERNKTSLTVECLEAF